MKKILVTGGSGLAGLALKKLCPEACYVTSADYDLTQSDQVVKMYKEHGPQIVIHLAARVGGILANIKYPAEFFRQNVLINTHVIHFAHEFSVKKLVAVASNCTYPDKVENYPMSEDQIHDGPPAPTNFPYAYAKRAMLAQIQAYRQQFGSNFISVIPCNMYGPQDKFDDQNSHYIAALIKKIHQAKSSGAKSLKLLGTGKPLRQFLFSEDFAAALLRLLEKYDGDQPVNIAPEENLSIEQIAQIALEAMEAHELKIEFDPTAPDGQYRKDISTKRLLGIIGEFKTTPLIDGIRRTYDWYLKNIE